MHQRKIPATDRLALVVLMESSLQDITTSDADAMESHCTKVLAENLIMHINWAHIFAFTRQSSIIFLWRLRTLRCWVGNALWNPIKYSLGNAKPKYKKKNDKLYLQQIDRSFRLVFRFASIHFPQNIFALNRIAIGLVKIEWADDPQTKVTWFSPHQIGASV